MGELPEDEILILNSDLRLFKSWASAEVEDSQGEIIPIKKLHARMPIFIRRGGNIIASHTNKIVGKILGYDIAIHPKYNVEGIVVTGEVYKDYPHDDEVWKNLQTKKYKGMSFGGWKKKLNGEVVDYYPNEISFGENPSNPGAELIVLSESAKTDDKKEETEKSCSQKSDKMEEKKPEEPAPPKTESKEAAKQEVKPPEEATPTPSEPTGTEQKPSEKQEGDETKTLLIEIRDMLAKLISNQTASAAPQTTEATKTETPKVEESKKTAVPSVETPRAPTGTIHDPDAKPKEASKKEEIKAIATGKKAYSAADMLGVKSN